MWLRWEGTAGLAWIWWDWAKEEVRPGQTPLGRARQDSVQSDRTGGGGGGSEAGLMGGAGLRWAGMIWKGLN